MSNTKDVVDCRGAGGIWVKKLTEVLQDGVADLLVALFTLDNSKQLSFSIRIKRPWIVV
jgi:hypothetical protein